MKKFFFYDPLNFVRVSFVMRKIKLSNRLDRTNAHFNPRVVGRADGTSSRRFKGLRVSHFRYPASRSS